MGQHIPAAIVGSAFAHGWPELRLDAVELHTPWGPWTLHQAARGWVSFRHGLPHRWLPHQIPYRAQACALAQVGVNALLVTSSVGVLDATLPLNTPLVVSDLFQLDNRLPDGSACTLWPQPVPQQAHLVVEDGLFDSALSAQLTSMGATPGPLVFGWMCGPRTKTAAEHRLYRTLGAQVNAMTLAPEVVLANELEIPTAAVVVGHKYSGTGRSELPNKDAVSISLQASKAASRELIARFLDQSQAVSFGNHLYRFEV